MATITLLVFWGIHDSWQARAHRSSYVYERGFLNDVLRDDDSVDIAIASAAAALGLMAVNWLAGRWAGKAICIKGRAFGWVGFVTPMAGMVFSIAVGLLGIYLLDPNAARYLRWEPLLIMGCLAMAFLGLPGGILGILGGLVLRQHGRRVRDAALWQPSTDDDDMEVESIRSLRRDRRRRIMVACVAAAIAQYLAIVVMGAFVSWQELRYPKGMAWDFVAPLVLGGLVVPLMAPFLARWAADRQRWDAQPTAMVLLVLLVSSLVAIVVIQAFRIQLDDYDRVVWRVYGWSTFWMPLLHLGLRFFTTAIVPAVLAGQALRAMTREAALPEVELQGAAAESE